tara:strand:- start:24 stop:476 length:453 start_codon:yes stop_codon:yes gene_type:complete
MSRSHQGINYYFAYYSYEENKWVLVNQRFLITSGGNFIIGQYITSMWFNYAMHKENSLKFAVFGVKNRQDKNYIIDLMNNKSINKFICEYFEVFESYEDTTKKLVNETKDKESAKYTFLGRYNNQNKLHMCFNYCQGDFLATLPEFCIET